MSPRRIRVICTRPRQATSSLNDGMQCASPDPFGSSTGAFSPPTSVWTRCPPLPPLCLLIPCLSSWFGRYSVVLVALVVLVVLIILIVLFLLVVLVVLVVLVALVVSLSVRTTHVLCPPHPPPQPLSPSPSKSQIHQIHKQSLDETFYYAFCLDTLSGTHIPTHTLSPFPSQIFPCNKIGELPSFQA